MCDEILRNAVEGISDLITTPGMINVDFADIRSIMQNAGSALMGIGVAGGEKRAEDAARLAINSPLLDVSINGAKGVLFAIAGNDDLGMMEIQDAARIITESVDPDARIIFGAVRDDKLKKDEVKVTVIASGFPANLIGETSLFEKASTDGGEEEEEESGGFFGGNKKEKEIEKEEEEEKTADAAQVKEDDEDEWGAVPAFLRRRR